MRRNSPWVWVSGPKSGRNHGHSFWTENVRLQRPGSGKCGPCGKRSRSVSGKGAGGSGERGALAPRGGRGTRGRRARAACVSGGPSARPSLDVKAPAGPARPTRVPAAVACAGTVVTRARLGCAVRSGAPRAPSPPGGPPQPPRGKRPALGGLGTASAARGSQRRTRAPRGWSLLCSGARDRPEAWARCAPRGAEPGAVRGGARGGASRTSAPGGPPDFLFPLPRASTARRAQAASPPVVSPAASLRGSPSAEVARGPGGASPGLEVPGLRGSGLRTPGVLGAGHRRAEAPAPGGFRSWASGLCARGATCGTAARCHLSARLLPGGPAAPRPGRLVPTLRPSRAPGEANWSPAGRRWLV